MHGQPLQQPPPYGYYPDPTGQPQMLRIWDGTQWTEKTLRMPDFREPRPDPSWSPPHPQTRYDYQQGLQSSAVSIVRTTVSGWLITALITGAFVIFMIVVIAIFLF